MAQRNKIPPIISQPGSHPVANKLEAERRPRVTQHKAFQMACEEDQGDGRRNTINVEGTHGDRAVSVQRASPSIMWNMCVLSEKKTFQENEDDTLLSQVRTLKLLEVKCHSQVL